MRFREYPPRGGFVTPTPAGDRLFRMSSAEVVALISTELTRLAARLAGILHRHRARGRTPAGDALGGLLIEDGEAEGLIVELIAALGAPPNAPPPPPFPSPEHPLGRAAAAFDLTAPEYDLVLLALAVEWDARFGRLVAYLNDHAGHTRPTIGLAQTLADEPVHPVARLERPVFRDGLLELDGDGPIPGLEFRLPVEVLRRLTDVPDSTASAPTAAGGLDRLVLAPEVRAELARWAEAVRSAPRVPALVLSGVPGSGRRTAARAAAADAGAALVPIELGATGLAEALRRARCEARWHGAGVLVRVSADEPPVARDWPALWAGLADVSGPVVVAVPPEVADAVASAAPVEPVTVHLGEPDAERQAGLWRVLLPPGAADADTCAALADRFRFTPGRIARAVRLATAGPDPLTRERLEWAGREASATAMGPLARKMPLPFRRSDLVVGPQIAAELDLAVAWVAHRRRVLHDWGFVRRLPLGHGLTCLFAGPPGTGKTMAAQVLARELGLDLYRVDLSRITSKFVGESEKLMARLFDEGRAANAAIFFDECEAVFGKRSETKDAHDRYANMEVAFLLQRMEEYDGVTVLATNRLRDLDEAFVRRFHVIADFPLPGPVERERIWAGMFPPEAEVSGLDFGALARGHELSGGEIKNAALAAAYAAAAEGAAVGMGHVARAVRREQLKSGRVVE